MGCYPLLPHVFTGLGYGIMVPNTVHEVHSTSVTCLRTKAGQVWICGNLAWLL